MRISFAVILLTAAPLGGSEAFSQNSYVNLGPTADFAFDQPLVSLSMSNRGAALGPSNLYQTMLLDTGASSIVIVDQAANDLHRSSGNFNTGIFQELGVGGFINYFVSEPYTANVNGNNSISLHDVKVLSDPDQSFGLGAGFYGIVGMPAMVNRVTSLGFGGGGENGGGGPVDWTDLDSIIDYLISGGGNSTIGVEFGDRVPPSTGHRYSVPVTALHFDPEGAATPTAAPLPALGVSHRLGCETSTGNYVFDTGAQLSIMSMAKLAELGLTEADSFTEYDVQGVGGIRKVPAFIIDEYRIETSEGIDLVWRDEDPDNPGLQVIGLDLHPSLDGVIGSDLLTGGLLDLGEIDINDIFGSLANVDATPSIDGVHLDFREIQQADHSGTGTIFFDIAADVNLPTDQGIIRAADANADGVVDKRDYDVWLAHNGQSNTRCATGDFNRDGRTDAADLAIWTEQTTEVRLPCDFDRDASCTIADIDQLLKAVGTVDERFDLDTSGGPVDLADRDQWLSAAGVENIGAPYLLGDLNLDGRVDPIDLNRMGQHWTQTGGLGYADGDVDGDQFVGPMDLNALGQNWLSRSAPLNAAVPEPSSLVAAVWASCLAGLWRRRRHGIDLVPDLEHPTRIVADLRDQRVL